MWGSISSDLFTSSEHEGHWWVPAIQDSKIPGTLKFDPSEGLELRLLGKLESDWGQLGKIEYPVLYGELTDGTSVTLLDAKCTGTKVSSHGSATCRYWVGKVLGGCHLESADDRAFTELHFRIRNGEQFAGQPPFQGKQSHDSEGHTRYCLEYIEPEPQVMRLGEVTISVTWQFARQGSGLYNPELTTSVWYAVRNETPVSLDSLLEGPAWTVSTLLQLSANQYLPLAEVHLYSPKFCLEGHEVPISVLERQAMRLPLRETLYRQELLFTLEALKSKPEILDRWGQFRKIHKSTFDTFFMGLRFGREFTLQHQFLDHVYALESYHRRSTGVRKKNLKQRVMDLCQGLPPEILDGLGEFGRFCSEVALTRNYLAHQDDTIEASALTDLPLYLCILRLGLVMRCVILKEVGFDEEEVARMMKQHRLVRQIKGLIGQNTKSQ